MKRDDLITEELREIDDRCKTWARVTGDRPHYLETMLFKAMVQYGGYKPEKNRDDPEPLPPLSREEILDGWLIDRAWRDPAFAMPHKKILQLWYMSPWMDEKFAAKIMRCRVRDIRPRLRTALVSLQNIARKLDNSRQWAYNAG